jgi:hypothetical protein
MNVYYNLNKEYKVEYYYEDSNGDFVKDSESQPREGVSGDTVSVTEEDKTPVKDGYVYDSDNKDNVITTELTPSGDTILKVYFTYEKEEIEPTTPEETTTEEVVTSEETTTEEVVTPEETTTEKVTTPEETTTEKTTTPEETTTQKPTTKSSTPIKTGDAVSMTFMTLLVVSGATVVTVMVGKKKKED